MIKSYHREALVEYDSCFCNKTFNGDEMVWRLFGVWMENRRRAIQMYGKRGTCNLIKTTSQREFRAIMPTQFQQKPDKAIYQQVCA